MKSCLDRDTIHFTVFETPVINAGPDTTYCGNSGILGEGASILPSGDPLILINWNCNAQVTITNETSLHANVNVSNTGTQTQTYTFTLNVYNGPQQQCHVTDDVTITFAEPPVSKFTVIPPRCYGEPAILKAVNETYFEYYWSLDNSHQSYVPSIEGQTVNNNGGAYEVLVSWNVDPKDTLKGKIVTHPVSLTAMSIINGIECTSNTIWNDTIIEPAGSSDIPKHFNDTCMLEKGMIRWDQLTHTTFTMIDTAGTHNNMGNIWSNLPVGNYRIAQRYRSLNADTYEDKYNTYFGDAYCRDTVVITIDTIGMMEAIAHISLTTENLDNLVIPATVTFVNSSDYAGVRKRCEWHWGDGTSVLRSCDEIVSHTYLVPGEYKPYLVIMNSDLLSCRDTSELLLLSIDNKSKINVPNVFSPNGDGINDYFQVDAESLKEFYGEIRNRWGEKMYSWTNWQLLTEGWNGKTMISTNASSGVYYYIIKAKGLDNVEYDLQGFLHLIRGE
jgi:gliding motility-associated-like protein